MGGMGSEDVFEAKEPMVCKSSLELLLELAETPTTKRQDQAPHKA